MCAGTSGGRIAGECERDEPHAEAVEYHAQKKQLHAREQETERVKGLRQDYRERAADWLSQHLKFLDESGVYLGMTPRYGWAPAGERVHEAVPIN